MKKRLLRNNELSPIKKIVIGIAMTILSFLLLSIAISTIAFTNSYAPSRYGFLSAVAFILSGGIGTFNHTKILRNNTETGVICALLIILVYFVAVLISNGKIIGTALMNSACFMLSSVLGAFLGTRKKQNKRTRKYYN